MADLGQEEHDESAIAHPTRGPFSIFNRNLSAEVSQLHEATRMKLPSFSESDDESGSDVEIMRPIRSVPIPALLAEGADAGGRHDRALERPSSSAAAEIERTTEERRTADSRKITQYLRVGTPHSLLTDALQMTNSHSLGG
jgi:hypothetical protein